MERMTFDDARIDAVRMGAPLTPEERAYLIEDTPTYEECTRTCDELAAMSDADLMTTAMWVWVDFCR